MTGTIVPHWGPRYAGSLQEAEDKIHRLETAIGGEARLRDELICLRKEKLLIEQDRDRWKSIALQRTHHDARYAFELKSLRRLVIAEHGAPTALMFWLEAHRACDAGNDYFTWVSELDLLSG